MQSIFRADSFYYLVAGGIAPAVVFPRGYGAARAGAPSREPLRRWVRRSAAAVLIHYYLSI